MITEIARRAKENGTLAHRIGQLTVLASVHPGEVLHVSIAHPKRNPTWEEIKRVRRLYWDDQAEVVMMLPPEDEYVNIHEYCYHLWGDVHGVRRWRLKTALEV